MITEDLGLYDSDTGQSILPDRVALVDLGEPVKLVYARAKRGRLVQLQWSDGMARIHYFYDEPVGEQMIREDGDRRWPSVGGEGLLDLIRNNAAL